MRDRDERMRAARSVLADGELREPREPVGGEHGDRDERERADVAPQERQDERDREPHRAVRAELRQPDEDVVQRRPAVPDDPPLGVTVPAGQTGAIAFVWSINCCRSNGLPMNPCAPFTLACCCASSSTLPLNMTTGITPAP